MESGAHQRNPGTSLPAFWQSHPQQALGAVFAQTPLIANGANPSIEMCGRANRSPGCFSTHGFPDVVGYLVQLETNSASDYTAVPLPSATQEKQPLRYLVQLEKAQSKLTEQLGKTTQATTTGSLGTKTTTQAPTELLQVTPSCTRRVDWLPLDPGTRKPQQQVHYTQPACTMRENRNSQPNRN